MVCCPGSTAHEFPILPFFLMEDSIGKKQGGKMAKGKAANGSGTIRLRPDGQYGARVVVGYDIWTRAPIRKSICAKTKNECARKLREVAVEVDHGTYGHTTEQMQQEAAERFQASISERLSSQSF